MIVRNALVVVIDADVVHDLGDADDAVALEKVGDFGGMERGARTFDGGNGGNARGREDILAKRRRKRTFEHVGHAVDAHDVADLMRIGHGGRRAPDDGLLAEVFGDHHGGLDVHVRVDIAGHQVPPAAVDDFAAFNLAGASVLADADDHTVDDVDRRFVDLAGDDVDELGVFKRSVAGNAAHCRVDQASAIFVGKHKHDEALLRIFILDTCCL